MPETKKYPRLYLELLENKQKVRQEVMFDEFAYSPLPPQKKPESPNLVVSALKTPPRTSPVPSLKQVPKSSIIVKSPQPVQLPESLLEDIFSEKDYVEPAPIPDTLPIPTTEPAKVPPLKNVVPEKVYNQMFKQLPEVVKKPDPDLLFKKQKLLVKFDILRKNGSRSIPIYTMEHDYIVMKKHYKLLVKQLHVDNKVTFYKQCLLSLCGCIELGLGEAGLGLDMEGYANFQANNMNKYEKLLIKIGEKSYMPSSVTQLPVEMQLCVTLIIQTMIFTSTKLLKNKIGFNLSSLFGMVDSDKNLQMPI
jgi:hypothetical protein